VRTFSFYFKDYPFIWSDISVGAVRTLNQIKLHFFTKQNKNASDNRTFTICGLQDGHLKMLGGNLEFFMKPDLASLYLHLKKELEELI
jgi:hypothetical protein